MSNNKVNFALINIIVLVSTAVVSFLLADSYAPLFWVSLAFAVMAFVLQALLKISLFDGETEGYFFSLPITYLSVMHVIFQCTACLVFAIMPRFSFKAGFALQFILFMGFLTAILAAVMGKNNLTAKSADKKASGSYMALAAAELSSIQGAAEDTEISKKLRFLYEAVKMANPMVSPMLKDIDNDIKDKISLLKAAVNDKPQAEALIREIKILINERNNRCKTL